GPQPTGALPTSTTPEPAFAAAAPCHLASSPECPLPSRLVSGCTVEWSRSSLTPSAMARTFGPATLPVPLRGSESGFLSAARLAATRVRPSCKSLSASYGEDRRPPP